MRYFTQCPRYATLRCTPPHIGDNAMQVTIRSRFGEETFESPYSNAEVQTRFLTLVSNGSIKGNFAADLAAGIRRFRNATERQFPWLHNIVRDAEQPSKGSNLIPGFQSIVDHMTRCRDGRENGGKGLLYPAIMLMVEGQKLVLKLQGKNSKNAGGVCIASERGFGKGDYFGKITRAGDLDPSKLLTPKVLEILKRIAANPALAISQLGKEIGCCCYCFIPLTTVQSKIAGCGDTCADNWQVWYPNAAETREFVAANPGVLEGASDRDRWV